MTLICDMFSNTKQKRREKYILNLKKSGDADEKILIPLAPQQFFHRITNKFNQLISEFLDTF